ncbi:MAG: type secretory pathway, ATPase PulE/Tfp pilus assembly pathway, ATPase PilB [Phycisphaerales bacterium]|nr:type secretory pathway, ATPase PulE/Tfp pilus assembly pathway, ATPase PilB [Phycisphaerales bacterium]
MDRARMGELLYRIGQLSSHDVDEVLCEQRQTRQRFGAIAVSLGFCQPEHVWAAWCSQLSGNLDRVNLDEIGIDAQAVECLPRELALGLRAMPVRLFEGQLIIALSDPARADGVAEMARRIGLQVKFVLADDAQIQRALLQYYPPYQAAC